MSVLPTLLAVPSISASRAIAPLRRVGKTSSSSTLNGESTGDGQPSRGPALDAARRRMSQNGPQDGASVWHGPLLKPSFVAQVLGQVLMDGRAQALDRAPAAYRAQLQTARGLVVDTDV